MRLVANCTAIPLLVIVHIGAIALLARFLGSKVYEVGFGFGPVLKRCAIKGTVLALRAIPLGGFVRMEADEEAAPPQREPNGIPFSDLGRLARALVYAAGCLATFGVAVLLLGMSEAAASFGRGFGQFLGGAIAPLSQGVENLRSSSDLLRSASFPVSLGVIASKVAAFNLIPLPSLNGFHILSALLLGRAHPGWLAWLMNGGALLLFLAIVSYGVAAVSLYWHG